MGKLFGTNGIRGVTNRELTPELALGMGRAIGKHFGPKGKVLVGRDIRAGGDMLIRALESGLLSSGVKVYDAGLLPTPALQYGVKTYGYNAGVMVTASHNPPEFNGIKTIDSIGIETDQPTEETIERYYFAKDFHNPEWHALKHDVKSKRAVLKSYNEAVLKHVDADLISKRKFKVVIDSANSVGSLSTPVIAERLGCEVVDMNNKLNPLFPGRKPEPNKTTLEKTVQKVIETGADFGVAHDGDADRAVFIDNKGTIRMGDRTGALLSRWLGERDRSAPRHIVTPFSSSNLVGEYLEKYGISVRWTHVGSIYVARELLAHGGISGFEDNGGFMYPKHQMVRDGPMTFALMLQMLAEESKEAHSLYEELPKYYTVNDKVPIREGLNAHDAIAKVTETYRDMGTITQIDVDGIKFVAKDFWFIVRKSGTEPIIRVSVEAKDEGKLKPVLERIKSFL